MTSEPDERWRAAFTASQDRNRRQFMLAVIYVVADSLFAFAALAGAVYLIYNGRALGLLLAFAGANFANIRRFASIVRNWLDQAERD